MEKFNFKLIEKKWQNSWEKEKIFAGKELKNKKKFYAIDMFPYASGEGLHMGHAFAFSIQDIMVRFKRLQGYSVLYPIGYDALGLPAENSAIKSKIHPRKYTQKAIENFKKQQKALGLSYDWSRVLDTSNSNYYKWDQWIFLKMLERGIAYRKKAPVNWCPKCKTVLANEQVVDGKCWRHEDTNIEIKHLEQWFLRITDYSDELLESLENLDWPEIAKKRQRNWIGKSFGTEIKFKTIRGENKEEIEWPIFTTRPDTIFGVTFMVISLHHPELKKFVTKKQKEEIEKLLKKSRSVSEKEMKEMEKEGAFTGSYAINPLTKKRVPIYAGNFVLADYGSGMVMAVPAHDSRDFEFAKKYKIEIKKVIENKEIKNNKESAYTGEGKLINSGKFNGINSSDAKEKITKYLEEQKIGKKVINYKLRDWLISRQRYWGTPIPIVYCDKCGIVPIPEKNLPVKLPEDVSFGEGNPLKTNEKWLKIKCPKCGGQAKRETDTLDTFVNSSWYYLRYADPKNSKKIFDSKKANYWAPIDQYVGGPEHITAHLIYIRFYTKFLNDLGIINFREPAIKYFTQGIVHDAKGERMSKSKGNVIEPIGIIKRYGADSLRLALMGSASPDKDVRWDEKILNGSFKFLNAVYNYFEKVKINNKENERMEHYSNKAIKEIGEKISNFKYNLAIIELRNLFEKFPKENSRKILENFLIMLSVFCPHITEEIWHKLGNKNFISLDKWPKFEGNKINEKIEKKDQAVEKLVEDLNKISTIIKEKEEKIPKKAFVYILPFEKNLFLENIENISKRTNLEIKIFSVDEKEKYDPTNKSKNVKPGRPAIYIE
jgi:leucyl-tRNA synthetase